MQTLLCTYWAPPNGDDVLRQKMAAPAATMITPSPHIHVRVPHGKITQRSGMYGDLVTAVAAVVFIPSYWYLCFVERNNRFGATIVTTLATGSSMLSWISWSKSDANASLSAVMAHAVHTICQFYFHWPFYGKSIAFPSLLWMLLRASVNFSLPFSYKLICGVVMLAATLVTSSLTPVEELTQSLPMYLGVTSVYIAFHYCIEQQQTGKEQVFATRIAPGILAGTLAYHFSYELSRMYSNPEGVVESGYSMLQAAFFAAFGFITAGAFSEQVNISKALEQRVEERTRELVKQARELQVIGMVVQATETAVAIVDGQQRIEWSNPALENMLHKEKVEVNSSLMQAFSLSEESQNAFKRAFDSTTESEIEIEVKNRFYRVEVAPIPVADGMDESVMQETTGSNTSPRFIVSLKDISEQRERDNSEKKAQKEELLKKAMLNSMETLSHEIRTPLQGIMGMASLLFDAEDLSIKEAKDGLSMVMISSRMLLTLINNLLDVRKCDESLLEGFELSAVPLSQSLQEATDFCKPIGSVTNVHISTQVDRNCQNVLVRSNPIRFQQVLINLVSNAIKYTKPETCVRISATVMPLQKVNKLMDKALECGLPYGHKDQEPSLNSQSLVAVVSVIDCGDGVPVSSAGKLFQRFSQSTASRSMNVIGKNSVAQPTGTGLGLNLCLKFIERMHGNIWVSNDPDGGACFAFYLPLAEEFSESNPCSVALCHMTPLPELSGRNSRQNITFRSGLLSDYKVLVVDDTIVNLKVMERMLSRIGLKHVTTVDSGAKALAFLEKEIVDLVLTDIQMPHMSGQELSEIIRQGSKMICSPVVVAMTAETSEHLYERCKLSGIALVLHKPITAIELERFFSETVPELIGSSTSASSASFPENTTDSVSSDSFT